MNPRSQRLTGGMGAYSPLPQLPETDYQRMLHEVVEPTIAGLRQEEFDYCGILYIGLIMTEHSAKTHSKRPPFPTNCSDLSLTLA